MPTTSENFNPEISCIYVNYRSAEVLSRSLHSLFWYETSVPFEVIIVNNDQEEHERIQALADQFGARVESLFQNPGFGAAANKGASQARGNILFFVNPDTEWQTGFFGEVRSFFQNEALLGALGIQLVSPSGVWEKHNAGPRLTVRSLFGWVSKKIEWLSGGALFVSKAAFQGVGGFDEQFFLYFEDMDFCLRLQKSNYRVVLFSKKQLVHFGGGSQGSKKSQKTFYDQSLYQYTKKHWSLPLFVLFRVLHPVYRFFFPYGR